MCPPVNDGQAVSAAVTNPAFLDAQVDDSAAGKIDLANTDVASGPTVVNTQREINSLDSFTGRTAGSAYNATPSYANNQGFTVSENLEARTDAISGKFHNTTGHTHSGAAGDGGPLQAASAVTSGIVTTGTQSFAGDKTFDGNLIANAALEFLGSIISNSQDDATTGAIAALSSTGKFLIRMTGAAPDVQGITNAVDSKILILVNAGAGSLIIRNQNAGATAIERIITGTGSDLTLTGGSSVWLEYDNTTQRWRVIGGSGGNSWSLLGNAGTTASNYLGTTDAQPLQIITGFTIAQYITATQQTAFNHNAPGSIVSINGDFEAIINTDSSTGIINALTTSLRFGIRMTGAAPDVRGLTDTSSGKTVILINAGAGSLVIRNQNVSASASERIITGTGGDLTLSNGSSVWLHYDSNDLRWRVIGGAGSNQNVVSTFASPSLITAAGGIGFSGTTIDNVWFIAGNGGPITVTANPQIAVPTAIGQRIEIIGTDDTNTVTLNDGNGLMMNGPFEIGKASSIRFIAIATGSSPYWMEEGRSV